MSRWCKRLPFALLGVAIASGLGFLTGAVVTVAEQLWRAS